MLIELGERRQKNQTCKKKELIKEQKPVRRIRWHPEQGRLAFDRADICCNRNLEGG